MAWAEEIPGWGWGPVVLGQGGGGRVCEGAEGDLGGAEVGEPVCVVFEDEGGGWDVLRKLGVGC